MATNKESTSSLVSNERRPGKLQKKGPWISVIARNQQDKSPPPYHFQTANWLIRFQFTILLGEKLLGLVEEDDKMDRKIFFVVFKEIRPSYHLRK